jgi:hypothetical protein
LDVDARNFVTHHIGLDLVVLFQEREEVVEVLSAHILNTKVIHDEAKLDQTPLVSPKTRSGVGFIVALFFQLTAEEIVG